MIKNSLFAAALAFASFTALPALAHSTPASPPASAEGTVKSDVHKKDAKSMKKPSKDAKAKTDAAVKTDPVTK